MRLLNNRFTFLSITLFSKILINLVIVFYVAKKISLDSFGEFILAFSYSTIFTLIFDYGFNLKSLILTIKEERFHKVLNGMIGGKILIVLCFLPLILLGIQITTYSESLKLLISILTLAAIFTSFGNFFLNLFKIIDKYSKETIGYILQVILLFAFLIFLNLGQANSAYNFALCILVTKIIYSIFAFIMFKKWFPFKLTFSCEKIIYELRNGFSYAAHLILGSSIIYIDTFILSIYEASANVGLYQAGMRIIMASMLMSTIINDAYLPKVANNLDEFDKIKKDLSKLFTLLTLFVVLVSIVMFSFNQEIISILYTNDFLVLHEYIIYIILIIALRYSGIIPGIILTAFQKQKIRAFAVFASLIIGIVLNFYLIPKVGLEGAFIASLVSHIVLNIIYFAFSYPLLRAIKFSLVQ